MLVERLINQASGPLLEQVLRFTAARHRLIAESIANVDTPGYVQKDLDVHRFYGMLRERIEHQRDQGDAVEPETALDDVDGEIEHPTRGILFHDGNNRSMEQLASDEAKNAMLHNLVIELLRKQFQQMDMALKEKVT